MSDKYKVQTYLEPVRQLPWMRVFLVGEVLDIMKAEKTHALLDISATCRKPDVIEAPYRPALMHDLENGEYQYFMGGSSCLTADCFGQYKFEKELKSGDRVAFWIKLIIPWLKQIHLMEFHCHRLPCGIPKLMICR